MITLYRSHLKRLRAVFARGLGSSARHSQTPVQVNDELAQRSITLLSGETCFAPTSKACLKGWNATEQSTAGEPGVSRGRSTDPFDANEDGNDRTIKKEEPSINSVRGNPSSFEETTGSLSRPGRTALARIEKPALSLLSEWLLEAVVGASNSEPALRTPLVPRTQILR